MSAATDPSSSLQSGSAILIDRRTEERYSIVRRCFVWPDGPPPAEAWRCIAFSISENGLGITMPFAPALGTVLSVSGLELPSAPPLRARVVRTTAVEFLWFCGCELLRPLSAAEFQAWIK
jgi:hypothetical protein